MADKITPAQALIRLGGGSRCSPGAFRRAWPQPARTEAAACGASKPELRTALDALRVAAAAGETAAVLQARGSLARSGPAETLSTQVQRGESVVAAAAPQLALLSGTGGGAVGGLPAQRPRPAACPHRRSATGGGLSNGADFGLRSPAAAGISRPLHGRVLKHYFRTSQSVPRPVLRQTQGRQADTAADAAAQDQPAQPLAWPGENTSRRSMRSYRPRVKPSFPGDS